MKRLILISVFQLFTFALLAQAPQKTGYQAVIRNSSGNLIVNKTVGIRITILQGSISGSAVYSETHSPSTNVNGLVSLEIGAGLPLSGSFSQIAWDMGPYFLKTETDPAGGSNYTITGTSQLISVPYALHAGSAPSVMPVHTQTEIDVLVPVQGQQVYNSTLKTVDVYVGTRWRHITTYDCGVCADGEVSECEECDDQNSASGDGCESTCKADLGWNEPNDTKATANPFTVFQPDRLIATFSGNDEDYYQFLLPAGVKIKFTDVSKVANMEISDADVPLLSGTGELIFQNTTSSAKTFYIKFSSVVKTKPSYARINYTTVP